MDDAIHRAARPGATVTSVLQGSSTSTSSSRTRSILTEQDRTNIFSDNNDSTLSVIEGSKVGKESATRWFRDKRELESYFNALLSKPCVVSGRGAVGLLASGTKYFSLGYASAEECSLYLQSVSTHIKGLEESMRINSELRFVNEIFLAVGSVATRCTKRCDISSSGIILALESLVSPSVASADGKQKSPPTLTAPYVEFLQTCVSAGHYSYACDFTDRHQVYRVPSRTHLNAEQYLRYFYLLGLVRLGCQRYRDAIAAFQICITMPSQVISAISIAARKKELLAKCLILDQHHDQQQNNDIHDGQADPNNITSPNQSNLLSVPQCASPAVLKFFADVDTAPTKSSHDDATPFDQDQFFGLQYYNQLVISFQLTDLSNFNIIKQNMKDLLKLDGNIGLVNQVNDQLLPRKLTKFAQVYESISLSKLTVKLGFATSQEVESLIIKMSSQRNQLLSAKIDQEDSIVYFQPYNEDSNDNCQEDLTKHIHQCMELADRIRSLDVSLATSKRYQALLMKDSAAASSSSTPSSIVIGRPQQQQPRGVAELSGDTNTSLGEYA